MILTVLTPAAGKRLIAKAIAQHPAVRTALKSGTVVIIAGTTNGYVAEELLALQGQTEGFESQRFFRGITLPPSKTMAKARELSKNSKNIKPLGDVVIVNGKWLRGKTIFDVIDALKEGDVILKGANAVDVERQQAGVLIEHPKGGTIIAALQAVIGQRARLIIPVGLEKRVTTNLNDVAKLLNQPGASGARMLPITGEIITELEALTLLSGARAELVAAGGVGGAEGAVWLAVSGNTAGERKAQAILADVQEEPAFIL